MGSEKNQNLCSKIAEPIKTFLLIASLIANVFLIYYGIVEHRSNIATTKLLRQEKKIRNQADVCINYVETDYNTFSTGGEGKNFEEICLRFCSYLEKQLHFDVKLKMLESSAYDVVKEFHDRPKLFGIPKSKDTITFRGDITFLLIRNAGGGKATNVVATLTETQRELHEGYITTQSEIYPVEIGELGPGRGVLIPISSLYRGASLTPGDSLEYFDRFLNDEKKIAIPPRHLTLRLIAPGVHLAIEPPDETKGLF